MDDVVIERIEDKFTNTYTKFDILDIKLNDFHIEFEDIDKMIDIIISDEYSKIYKTYYPIKNYDLIQDKFFIYAGYIDVPAKEK